LSRLRSAQKKSRDGYSGDVRRKPVVVNVIELLLKPRMEGNGAVGQLSCASFVPVMQAAHFRKRNDAGAIR
jgi:hypothetical protein